MIYCRDKLGSPADRMNVNGGAICAPPLRRAGHDDGTQCSKAAPRAKKSWDDVLGGGMGAAGVFEVL